jgi:molecular chaperone Hsp33
VNRWADGRHDELHKFLFEGLPVRGMLVRLTGASGRRCWRARNQQGATLPGAGAALLGEMAAAGALMQANIKFNGALILQVFGDGPVKLAVAEVQPDLSFRATAKVVGEVADRRRLEAMLNVHGKGRCAITLDPKDRLPGQQPYQGVVPLHGDRASRCRPERGAGALHAAVRAARHALVLAANDEVAAGLLIQRLPVEGEGNLAGGGQRRRRRDRPERGLQPHRPCWPPR